MRWLPRLFSAFAFALVAVAPAKAANPSNPNYWYWQVADTSPSSEVWEATSGAFVSNTSSNFTTWLTLVAAQPLTYGGLALTICNAANNGSGAIRVTVCNPASVAGWATGQYKTVTGVGGVTAANGAWTITVVSASAGTIDLQGSTYSGTYTSGGVIGGGAPMDSAANMYALINSYNLQQATGQSALGAGSININSSTSFQLTNPLNRTILAGFTAGGQALTLPRMNLFGSMPIGYSLYIVNTSSPFTLKTFGGSTIATVLANQIWQVTLIDNSSQAGGTSSGVLFRAQPNCGDLGNATSYCSAVVGQLPGTATNDNASAGDIGEVMTSGLCLGPATTATVTISIAAPGVVTWTAHGFTGACPIQLTTTGALPTGLSASTTYWVVPSSITTNTFTLATTVANALAGTAITTSGTQSGTQTGTAGQPLSSPNAANVTGLALTAGDWDCRATVSRTLGASTSVTKLQASISQTSATLGTQGSDGSTFLQIAANVMGALGQDQHMGPARQSLSGSTNVFLVAQDTFSVAGDTAFGSLTCRRAR